MHKRQRKENKTEISVKKRSKTIDFSFFFIVKSFVSIEEIDLIL